MSQVSFTVSLSSSTGISLLVNPTQISFYPDNNVATVKLYINDATQWIVGASTNLVFTPTATTTTYAAGTSLPLTAVAAPGLPLTTLVLNTVTVDSVSFDVTCTEEGKFIYHLSRTFPYNETACLLDSASIKSWLSQSSLNGLRVSESYYQCEDVISAMNVQANVSQTFLLPSLESSTGYQLNGFCSTQSMVDSAVSTVNVSTASNGGIVSDMTFEFASVLTTAQKIKLVCALALEFQMDYTKVSTWDGYFCSELLNRRRLQEVGRLLQSTTSNVVVFFGVNTHTSADTSQTTVNANANTTALVDLLNSNVTGIPVLYSIGTNSGSYIGPNEIVLPFYMGSGPNFFYIDNLQLNQNGLVYVIMGDPNLWTRAPVISEIKTGTGPEGIPPVFFRVLSYKSTDLSSSNMAWTGLTSGSYVVYMVASDDNPFDTANFGLIHQFPLVSEVPAWEGFVPLSLLALLLLTLL